MTTITDKGIWKDSILGIRDLIASGVTDPISASRASDSKFVLTNYPDEIVNYPVVIVRDKNVSSERMGTYSEQQYIPVNLQLDIFARSVTEREGITGSVFDYLRTNQIGVNDGISGTQTWGLYDFRLVNAFNADNPPGMAGVHRKIMEIRYNYIAGD